MEHRSSKDLEDDAADPEDPPEPSTSSTVTTKKKKRRRKKHKGDPRREELTPPMSVTATNAIAANTAAAMSGNGQNEEIFEMDLSSDEDTATHVSRYIATGFILSSQFTANISFNKRRYKIITLWYSVMSCGDLVKGYEVEALLVERCMNLIVKY